MPNDLSRFPPKLPSVSVDTCGVRFSSLPEEVGWRLAADDVQEETRPLPFPVDDKDPVQEYIRRCSIAVCDECKKGGK